MSEKAAAPRIIVRCDASAQIGGGHVMRCLTLANALSEAGADVTFVTAAMPDALATKIVAAGHEIKHIAPSPEMKREGSKWEEPPMSGAAQLADAEATGAATDHADWVIVDHYLLDRHWHCAARSFADKILVIDDLANRDCDCDVLLDQTFARSAADYREFAKDATFLVGTTYAVLRPEFARERPAALDRRETSSAVERMLVSMGTTDPGNVTCGIVESVLTAAPECTIDVVVGPQAGSLARLQALAAEHPRVFIHPSSDRMAELMRDADLAIGGAGTTSWERCCLGLPTIALVLADNQRPSAEGLASAGAVVLANSPNEVPTALSDLIAGTRKRLSMSAAAAAIVDGHGAGLVASALLGRNRRMHDVELRPARDEDSRTIWLWRNDFITRRNSQESAPVPWPDHDAWWRETRESRDRELLIAEVDHAPVAAVRFDRLGPSEFEVSINLAPAARGSGLGGLILAKAFTEFQERMGAIRLVATIHRDNRASRSIFEKLGFSRVETLSKTGFERYVRRGGTAE